MITDRELQQWIDWLDVEIWELDALHVAVTGEPHRATRELAAFLQMNDALTKEKVEQAVKHFAETFDWPSLSGDQIVNLTHRVNGARRLLLQMSGGQTPRDLESLGMPAASDRARFISWLLINVWNIGGAGYLEALTDQYLAEQ